MANALIADGSGIAGYVRVGEEQLALRVTDCPTLALEADPRLRALLVGQEDAVEQRLRRSPDAASFVVELNDLLDRLAPSRAPAAQLPSARFYELVIRELDAVGWGSLQSVSPALDSLQLLVLDAAGRAHTLGLSLPPDYPLSPPTAQVSLPSRFTLHWPQQSQQPQHQLPEHEQLRREPPLQPPASAPAQGQHSLAVAIEQFREALAQHQTLWDMLDDLDAHTWVLEPKHPTREAVTRRLAIGSHCSLQLELHRGSPTALPLLQFLGADRITEPLRRALNANLARWQPARTVRLNLEAVLEMQFPAAQAADAEAAEEYASECTICYEYDLDGMVPEIACDGCGKPFHKACLSEWLRGLATTAQSFNRLFGECPFCTHPIAVESTAMQQ